MGLKRAEGRHEERPELTAVGRDGGVQNPPARDLEDAVRDVRQALVMGQPHGAACAKAEMEKG